MIKRLLFLSLFILLFSYHSGAQGNCTVPPVLTNFYNDDIGALTVQFMLSSTPDSDFIALPAVHYNEIAEGMAAIFNTSMPERDSVFDMYCIHWPYGVSICKGFIIAFDTSYAWTTAWQNVQTVTGNPAIDNIFSNHQLTVTSYNNWSFAQAVTVDASQVINYDALSDSLLMIPGISWCDPNALIGTAGYIEYTKSGTNRHYEFRCEWNDCFDGCDNSHTWKFDVDPNCNVTFAGSSDWWVFNYEPLPAPMNCNISTGLINHLNKDEVSIYPNPFTDQLNIRLSNNDKGVLKIRDLWGRIIFSKPITSVNSIIDLKGQPGGIYFIELQLDSRTVIKKVVKSS